MRNSAGSAYTFSQVPNADIPRCRLRRPSTHKTAINAGLLYPLFVDEVLPGDTFNLSVSSVARLSTLLCPIMDNIYMDWHFFFVPNRLVWDNWQKMHGERVDPDDSIDFSVPSLLAPDGGIAVNSLADYFGLPLGVKWSKGDVQSLPFRAYNLIWNDWFRDQNLQDSVTVKRDDTDDSANDYSLLPRGKRKDYFTSCLPEPQKGDAVTLPLGLSAPVQGNGMTLGFTVGSTVSAGAYGVTDSGVSLRTLAYGATVGSSVTGSMPSGYNKSLGITEDGSKSGLIADLSGATAASINTLREAFQLQRLLERDARGGTRYVELLRAHFGVVSPDARLQRPEFLGSFTVPVNIHTVVQTSASEDLTTAQGNLTAFGAASGVNRAFIKSFVEHGLIIGLCSIRADLTYQQGIPRMWSRKTRFDYYYPALAHLGEQAVLNKEIYAQGTSVDDEAFGYQERWSEYKYGYNRISGQLRSTASSPLDQWHLAQKFGSLPTLNETFITENPPISRSVAISDASYPLFIVDNLFDLTCIRPMPLYDVPGLVDHF